MFSQPGVRPGMPRDHAEGRFGRIIDEEHLHARRQVEAAQRGDLQAIVEREHRHQERQVRRAATLREFERIVDAALGQLTLEDILHELLDETRKLLRVDAAAIVLPDGDHLRPASSVGFHDPEAASALRLARGEGLAGRALDSDAPMVVRDLAELPDLDERVRAEGFSVLVGVPLKTGQARVGVLTLGHRKPRTFKRHDLALMQLVADRAASTIHRMQALHHERKRRLAAEQASQFKSDLLNMASHDLKTPLTAMALQVKLLSLARNQDDVHRSALPILERSINRLTLMLDDMLDLARLQSGSFTLVRERIDMARVARDAAEIFGPKARDRGIQFKLVAEDGNFVLGDGRRLGQVAANLLSNAVRYTPPEGRIAFECHAEGEHVVLRVTDNGRGLTQDEITRLFRPFTQVQGSKEEKQGTGLGLYLSRIIVEEHDGTVTLESEGLGHGVVATVRLPKLEGDVLPPKPLNGSPA